MIILQQTKWSTSLHIVNHQVDPMHMDVDHAPLVIIVICRTGVCTNPLKPPLGKTCPRTGTGHTGVETAFPLRMYSHWRIFRAARYSDGNIRPPNKASEGLQIGLQLQTVSKCILMGAVVGVHLNRCSTTKGSTRLGPISVPTLETSYDSKLRGQFWRSS